MPTIGWFEILIVVAIAIIILGPKDFPIMLKKVGSWIGTAKRYVSNIQNEVSNFDIEDEKINEIKKENKKERSKRYSKEMRYLWFKPYVNSEGKAIKHVKYLKKKHKAAANRCNVKGSEFDYKKRKMVGYHLIIEIPENIVRANDFAVSDQLRKLGEVGNKDKARFDRCKKM